jgi:DNA-binding MarR family transcriptional regulator
MRALLAIALNDAPIRADEYGVYSAIFMAGSLTPTQLARSTGMPLTTVTDYIRSMVERGHVERRPNPADGRSILLSLSPTGHETVKVVMPSFTQAVRTMLSELAVPRDDVLAALDALAAATERAMERLMAEDPAAAPLGRP